eukprot:COSAG06_NODE_47699_length_337_cov_0.995798_1_plen_84_part_01
MHRLMAPAGIVSMDAGASCPLQPRRLDPTIRFTRRVVVDRLSDSLDVRHVRSAIRTVADSDPRKARATRTLAAYYSNVNVLPID